MEVVALKAGFYQGAMRRKGTVFTVPNSFKATWAVPTGTVAANEAKEKPKKEAPRALSEMSKGAKSFIEQVEQPV